MRPLPAYCRENFKSYFFSGAFRIKFFLFENIVNIRNEPLIFLLSWEMNFGETVTNLPRTVSRFTEFVTCLTQVLFPSMQRKRHSFLKWLCSWIFLPQIEQFMSLSFELGAADFIKIRRWMLWLSWYLEHRIFGLRFGCGLINWKIEGRFNASFSLYVSYSRPIFFCRLQIL